MGKGPKKMQNLPPFAAVERTKLRVTGLDLTSIDFWLDLLAVAFEVG